jgi:hypothetical protein
VLAALVLPASAGAATFCVPNQAAASCTGSDAATITAALLAASGNGVDTLDTIRLAPGTYTEEGLDVADGNPVNIIGAGATSVITRTADGSVITLREGSVLSDLRITIPAGLNNNAVNGQAGGGRIERVLVTDSPANSTSEAIFGNVDVLNSTVLVPTDGSGGKAIFTDEGNFVRGSHVEGVVAFDGPGLVEDSTALAVDGFTVDPGEDVVVRDVLLQLQDGINPTAFDVDSQEGDEATVDARNVTVIGFPNGVFPMTGVDLFAEGEDPGTPLNGLAEVTLRNVVLHDMDTTFAGEELPEGNATATTRVDVAYSSFDPDPSKQTGDVEVVLGPGNIFANPPGFVSGTDFRPVSCASPLVDAGEPIGTTPGDVDAGGAPRLVAARSPVATTDIGAYELQHTPPTASITAAGSPPFGVGETIQFTGTLTGGGPFSGAWAFGDGATAAGASASHAFSAPGTYTVGFAGLPASGCLGAVARLQVEVSAVAGRVGLSRVRMTNRRFRVGKRRTPRVAKRAPVGTAFIYRVDQPATARIQIQRLRRGKRPKRVGTLRRRVRRARQVRTRFSGRIGRKALKPGRYRATITAGATGVQRSAARRITFRVVR